MENTKTKKKRVSTNETIYRCKDNDVVLKFCFEDNEIDEILVQVDGEKGWTVIGYKNLMTGIEEAKEQRRKDSMSYEVPQKEFEDFYNGVFLLGAKDEVLSPERIQEAVRKTEQRLRDEMEKKIMADLEKANDLSKYLKYRISKEVKNFDGIISCGQRYQREQEENN